MYVKDLMSDTGSYEHPRQLRRRDHQVLSTNRDTLTKSVALTDGFDAPTTEAPTIWDATGIEGVEGRDYDISIVGHQNYINEMEMMLSGQENVSAPPPEPYYPEREAGITLSARGSDVAGRARRFSTSRQRVMDNSREVYTQTRNVELVEDRILEDRPDRTISLWREQVAENTSSDRQRPPSLGSATRKMSSNDSQSGRYIPNRSREQSSGSGSAGPGRDGYERTEYIVSYHQRPSRHSDASRRLYTPSLQPTGLPVGRRGSGASLRPGTHQSQTTEPLAASTTKTSDQPYETRTEYMVSYLHTPPRSQGSGSRGSSRVHALPHQHVPLSPTHHRKHAQIESITTGSATKSTTTSPVELILASCEPSLLHIAPAMSEMGILKVEHLRAMAKMNEETRDRELKGQALMRGVTVMEWAILIDKLQCL